MSVDNERKIAIERYGRTIRDIENRREKEGRTYIRNTSTDNSSQQNDPFLNEEILAKKKLDEELDAIEKKSNKYVSSKSLESFDWERVNNLAKQLYIDVMIDTYEKLIEAVSEKDINKLKSAVEFGYQEVSYYFGFDEELEGVLRDIEEMCLAVKIKSDLMEGEVIKNDEFTDKSKTENFVGTNLF